MTDTTELTNTELSADLEVHAGYYEHYNGESELSLDLREAARRLRAMDEPVDASDLAWIISQEINWVDETGEGDAAVKVIEALGRKVKV